MIEMASGPFKQIPMDLCTMCRLWMAGDDRYQPGSPVRQAIHG